MDIIFSSERINFIKLNLDFVEEYLCLLNNPNIYKNLSTHHTDYTYEEEVEYVCMNQDNEIYSMINKDDGKFIGNISLTDINGNSGELGIVICEEFQDKHYGTEAIKSFLDYYFEVLTLSEIYLVVFSNNKKAINCYSNLGFEKYDEIPNVAIIDGEQVNDIYMKIFKP